MQKNFKTNAMDLFISSSPAEDAKPKDTSDSSLSVPRGYVIKRESKNVRLQLLVRPSTKNALKEAAAIQGTSMNDFINTILEDFLERQGNE